MALVHQQKCMISEWCGWPCGCKGEGTVDRIKANNPKLFPANFVCEECLRACGIRHGKASSFLVTGESVIRVNPTDETMVTSSRKNLFHGWANSDKNTVLPPFLPVFCFESAYDVPSKKIFDKKAPKTALIKHPSPNAPQPAAPKCVYMLVASQTRNSVYLIRQPGPQQRIDELWKQCKENTGGTKRPSDGASPARRCSPRGASTAYSSAAAADNFTATLSTTGSAAVATSIASSASATEQGRLSPKSALVQSFLADDEAH